MIFQLVSYVGTVLGFLFFTLSLASGLYYISEVVEEYGEPTKRFLNKAIYTIIVILLLLLLLDGFPWKLILLAIVSQLVYKQNLKTFPYISLTSSSFITSCILVVANHYLWFKHFNEVNIPPQFKYDPNYIPPRRATFSEVASFFGICIWFIPFALFVSLSSGEYVLPTTEDVKKNDDISFGSNRKNVGLVRLAINKVRYFINSSLHMLGFKVKTHQYDGLAL